MVPTSLKTFVANRISEILEIPFNHTWRHVNTKDNPADILSRGMTPFEIQNCSLWWNGPQWLFLDTEWPQSLQKTQELPEIKKQTLSLQLEPK